MRLTISALVVAVALLAGCGDGPLAEKPANLNEAADVIKTADQLHHELTPIIAPLRQGLHTRVQHLEPSIPDASRRQVVGEIREAVLRMSNQQNGREALRRLGYDIQDIAKAARDAERWHLVLACIDAFEVLNMQSYLLEKLDERARTILEQPKVEVQGYFHDQNTGEHFVFLKLTNRLTQEVTKERVREGEEVQNLRVIEIVGKNRGVKLEFTKIEGLYFTVGNFGKDLPERFQQN